jgi:hypothetical protein
MKTSRILKPLTRVTLGLILLLPASYFALSLTLRMIFGYTKLYYGIAPSFLESNPDIFSFNTAAWILYGPACCLLLNLPTDNRQSLFSGQRAVFKTHHWLNTAIFLQALMLFVLTSAWFFVQHYRYH